jgi:hypothetical protein
MCAEGAETPFSASDDEAVGSSARDARAAQEIVARAGIEPATFHFSGERYYRLSYLAFDR